MEGGKDLWGERRGVTFQLGEHRPEREARVGRAGRAEPGGQSRGEQGRAGVKDAFPPRTPGHTPGHVNRFLCCRSAAHLILFFSLGF